MFFFPPTIFIEFQGGRVRCRHLGHRFKLEVPACLGKGLFCSKIFVKKVMLTVIKDFALST